ncbi:hypothetical protein [Streptomyces rubradiris]|uniref:Uncharacterized protein n=1 Tax=Streptomyces rubradiris TaxID=285531 RepID=A0ABQ3RG82_STRRR|nr:hypothetical protein [Streptomyces rubradiris]GHI54812.1 hypothetical protein Srubr_46580 [Streptomyces rubradiris]
MRRHKRRWGVAVLGTALLTLGGIIPANASTEPAPGTNRLGLPPSATPAAAEQQKKMKSSAAAAGPGIPQSGKTPEAGPRWEKSGDKWQVRAAEVTLRNTVTDPDKDTADLTFDVWTVDAAGKPKAHVDTTNANSYGTPVSAYVASGSKASVTIDYGFLKPGWTYAFRTSAYDGAHYEREWSPWATFTVAPYVTFPQKPETTSTIDPKAQEIQTVNRTEPGAAVPLPLAPARKDEPSPCGKPDAEGNKLCWEFKKPEKDSKSSLAPPALPGRQYDLLPWCQDQADNGVYMTRTDACMRDLGEGTLIFVDTDPKKPALGIATFDFEQRIKAYPTKSESGSDFAEFDQQMIVIPKFIDPKLQIVRLKWEIGSSCKSCVTTQPVWKDEYGQTDADLWFTPAPTDMGHPVYGTSQTRWTGTGKETIDLSWKVTATVDAGGNPATADFGGTGIDSVRELAPRCDDYNKGVAPGCVLPYFKLKWTVDTNKYPAAGGYYWLMQERMKDHAGAQRWDSLLSYLGPDTMVKNAQGKTWTSDDSRYQICGKKWNPHKVPAAVGSTDCDEYAMASTHQSGGFPKSLNKVTDGSECGAVYTDVVSGNFGLLSDVGQDPYTLNYSEKCGRGSISSDQNRNAFKGFPAPAWRMLDGDEFFVDTPGFNHCARGIVTCDWKKIS